MSHSRKKLDLTGQRYGKLSVLAPAENSGKRTAWLCRCDCGEEKVVSTAKLRDGRRTSCGCGQRGGSSTPGGAARASLTYVDGTCVEMLQTRTVRRNNTSGVPGVEWLARNQRWRATICFKGKRRYLGSYEKFEDAVRVRKRAEEDLFDTFLDVHFGKLPESEPRDIEDARPPKDRYGQGLDLSGRQFGKLIVLRPAENIGNCTAWLCRCDCGQEVTVKTARLRAGRARACGGKYGSCRE